MEHTINLNLGRATIGDLFIGNKISQLRDGSTLENIHLKIPLYQRLISGLHAMQYNYLMTLLKLATTIKRFIE